MLRAEILDSADGLVLRLEGRLTGVDAEQTRTLTSRFAPNVKLFVDLTEVVFIDAIGEELLALFGRFGAEFIAPSSYTFDVCERLNLPMATNGNSHGKGVRPLHAIKQRNKEHLGD